MLKGQKTSSSKPKGFTWFGKDGAIHKEVRCGRIYFATDESILLKDDRDAIKELIPDLLNIATLGFKVQIRCKGNTDVRAPDEYNLDLSNKRYNSVVEYFKQQLLSYPLKDRYNIDIIGHRNENINVDGKGFGEKRARNHARFWAEDRRVDIIARVFPRAKAEENIGRKKRIERFRKYYQHYDKWVRRGLDYLIVQYESNDMHTSYVHIRPWDIDKVLDLLKELLSPEAYNSLLKRAKGEDRNEIIALAYEIIYRQIWTELKLKYQNRWNNESLP